MDKENGNRKRSTTGKLPPKKYKWEGEGAKRERKKGIATGGVIIVVKLGIKEEKGEEEGCMERKVHIGNKWWKMITIYSERQKYGINSLKIKQNFFRKNLWTGQF
jgi:hypothetical protein